MSLFIKLVKSIKNYKLYIYWVTLSVLFVVIILVSLLNYFYFTEPTLVISANVIISGHIYTNEGTTPYNGSVTPVTVRAKVNGLGDYTGTCNTSDGAYSISGVAIGSASDVVTVFIDGAAVKATTVTRTADNTSNITLDLYLNRIIVRHEDAGPITNANLGQYDKDNDPDIHFTSNLIISVALTVDNDSELHIWTGKSFSPGGTVTTSPGGTMGDIHIDDSATFTAGGAISCGGSWTADTGTTFTHNNNDVTFTATASGKTITTNSQNFYNLIFNGSGGAWTPQAAMTVSNNLTMTAGSLLGTQNINVNGGGIVCGASCGTINLTGGTVTLAGTGNFGTAALSSTWTFYNLTFNGATTAQGIGTITISNVLTINSTKSLNAGAKTWTLSGTGTPFVATGTFTPSTSTVNYTGNAATNITLATYYNLNIGGAATTATYTAAGNITANSVLTIVASSGTNTFDASSRTITLAGSGTPFVISATEVFTASTSTVVYSGSSATSVTSTTYNNLNIGGAATTAAYTVAGDITANSVLTIVASSGTNTFGASFYTITLAGSGTPFVINATEVFAAGMSTVVYSGSSATNVTATTYYLLNIGGAATTATYTAAGNMTIALLTIVSSSGTNTFDASSRTITLSGSGTPFVINATEVFTASTSTVAYTGTSATNVTSTTYYNLNIGGAGTTATYTAAGDIAANSVLTIVSSSGTNTFNASSYYILLGGSGTPFVINATEVFTASTSTVVYWGSSATNVTATTYYNLSIGGPGTTATYTAAGNMTIGSVLTIVSSSGTNTFNASSRTITLSGSGTPFVINATEVFTASTSTVAYTGTSATSVAAATYYNLNIGGAATTATYTAAGNMTIGSVLTIVSSSGTNTFNAASYIITLAGSGTPFVINSSEVFTPVASTVAYTGTSATNVTSATYYNLNIGGAATTATYTAAGNITANSVLTIVSSSGTNTFSASVFTITLAGSGTPFVINSSEVFSPIFSTVAYTGSFATNVTATAYYNLVLARASANANYDFRDTTNNTAKTTELARASDTPVPTDASWTNYSSDQYTAVAANDFSRNAWTAVSNSAKRSLYKIKINEAPAFISQIKTTWIGYCDVYAVDAPFILQRWNKTTLAWETWLTETDVRSSDQTYTDTLSSNISDYVDASGYFYASAKEGTIFISCPFIYSYDGEKYHFDHETFPYSLNKSIENSSYDNLPNLKAQNGELKVRIAEERQEKSYTNGMELYAVDYPKDRGIEEVIPDIKGQPHTIKNKETPLELKDDTGVSHVEEVSKTDGVFLKLDYKKKFAEKKYRDFYEAEFKKEKGQNQAKLLVAAQNTPISTANWQWILDEIDGHESLWWQEKILNLNFLRNKFRNFADTLNLKVELWNGKEWVYQGEIRAGREMVQEFLVDLNPQDFPKDSENLKVRLSSPSGHFEIDSVLMDLSTDEVTKVQKVEPKTAVLNGSRDMKKVLTNLKDQQYIEMRYGDKIDLTYDEPKLADGQERKYTVAAAGYYHIDPDEKTGPFVWDKSQSFWTNIKANFTHFHRMVDSIPGAIKILKIVWQSQHQTIEERIKTVIVDNVAPWLESGIRKHHHTMYENYVQFEVTSTVPTIFTLQAGTINVASNMTVSDGTYATTVKADTNNTIVDVNGNFSIAANGTYTASSSASFTIAGNFSNSGTFTHSSGTVTFDGGGGTTQSISGDTTFNNFIATTSTARTLRFAASSVTAVNGTWTITGAAGQLITLTTSSAPTQWKINPTAASVSYVDVNYSDNDGIAFCATYSISTNDTNTDWQISSGASCNTAPVNDSLTFTNPYSSNIAIADNITEWNFQAKVTDADGPTNINYIEIRFANGADSTLPYDSLKYRFTEATHTFSEIADTQNAGTITSVAGDATSAGNQWTVNFKIKLNNNFFNKDTNYNIELYSLDDAAASDDDNYANIYQVKALSLTFDVTDATVSLGTLDPTTVKTDTATMTAATNSSLGYSITVSGATLTSGGNTITAIGGTAAASSPGTEQLGLNLKANTTPLVGANPSGGSGVAVGQYAIANSFAFLTGDTVASCSSTSATTTFTMSYIANSTSITEPGSYSAIHIYICTGTF